ncbi:MAG: hypothetical protein O7D96_07635 [SAR324 cluster bacterium]|nr:hypothetical protein [SAR324 cluster bacterium]
MIDFIARTIYDRRITPTEPLSEYGLADPPIVVIFYPRAPDGSVEPKALAILYVGDTLPSTYAYYTRVPGDSDLTIIPLYQVNSLIKFAFDIELSPPGLRFSDINRG